MTSTLIDSRSVHTVVKEYTPEKRKQVMAKFIMECGCIDKQTATAELDGKDYTWRDSWRDKYGDDFEQYCEREQLV